MHVGGITLDPNPFLQWLFTLLVLTIAVLLHLLKNTASKYFQLPAWTPFFSMAQAQAHSSSLASLCASCGQPGSKQCSRCKSVKYCSLKCQQADWIAGHKSKCKEYEKGKFSPIVSTRVEFKASNTARRSSSGVALVPAGGNCEAVKKLRDVLFPYEEFIELYNWDKLGFPPCGLLNCGNSCFANVVLQCLTITRPLVAYLLEKGHRRECRRNDWCFLCALQDHVERSSQSSQAFSPANILSGLLRIGSNLGFGKQEDAHEFMRIAIDKMQSVCLDEFGGEKAVPHSAQETTLIQHIFGGRLQSQVICTECDKVSSQLENMMDLTVEIHGEVGSLEECLVRFTAKEDLHGDNMYKCDGCNDYVKAWKRLTIQRAPNILTIALKRFQSGRFGKLNKRVTFPETLDLSPYMSDRGDGSDVYKLYAVVVHVDMLNASFFGHYICYTKDFQGKWYRIDDCEVTSVELKEVLSQGAYMLLYSRLSVRPSCLKNVNPPKEQELTLEANLSSRKDEMECLHLDLRAECGSDSQEIGSNSHAADQSLVTDPFDSAVGKNTDKPKNDSFAGVSFEVDRPATNGKSSETCFSPNSPGGFTSETLGQDAKFMDEVEPSGSSAVPMEVSDCEDDQRVEYSGNADSVNLESGLDAVKVNGTIEFFASKATSTRALQLKRESHFRVLDADNGNGYKRAEVANGY